MTLSTEELIDALDSVTSLSFYRIVTVNSTTKGSARTSTT